MLWHNPQEKVMSSMENPHYRAQVARLLANPSSNREDDAIALAATLLNGRIRSKPRMNANSKK